MKLIVLALVFAALGHPLFGQQSEPERVQICDAFKQRDRWIGKMVEIRGVLESWAGMWLTGRDCPDHVVVDQAKFANLIALTDPQLKVLTRLHVDFSWDAISRHKLSDVFYYARLLHERVTATVVGVFETDTRREAMVSQFDPTRGMAYGDQGVAPAQILVKEIKDIVREPLPTPAIEKPSK